MKLTSPPMRRLASSANVTPELEGSDVPGAIAGRVQRVLDDYPGLERFGDWLELLRTTGGVSVDNDDFDLMLYGIGGYVVTAFDEGWFLSKDRYFVFGEIIYPEASGSEPYFFAFDLQSGPDDVYCREGADGEWQRCADSLEALVNDLAEGRYPMHPRASGT